MGTELGMAGTRTLHRLTELKCKRLSKPGRHTDGAGSEAISWKAVALGNIEYGVLFEKRDMAHFVRVGRLLDLGNEIHLDPVFPFADDSADVEGLFECEPTLGCVPVRP